MPLHSCKYCEFSTKSKYNFSRHLKTQKHRNKVKTSKEQGADIDDILNDYIMSQNEPKKSQNEPKMSQNEPKKFQCQYCYKSFRTKANMRRHELHRCKSVKNENIVLKIERVAKVKEKMRKQFEKEKNKLYNQIEMLIEKAGDTTINNIQLNNFGDEDTSYITDKMLEKMIIYPGSMISDLLSLTHFNKDHPENKNLKITNKKDKYIKVYKNDEWKLDKRDIVIDNIMHNKFDTLETYYVEKGKNRIMRYEQKRFEKFQDDIDCDNKDTMDKLKEDITLTIVNNS